MLVFIFNQGEVFNIHFPSPFLTCFMNSIVKNNIITEFRKGALINDLAIKYGYSPASIDKVIHPSRPKVTTVIKKVVTPTAVRVNDTRTKEQKQRDAGFLAAQTRRRNLEK